MATTVLEMMLANNLTANATVLTQICFQAASQNNFSMCSEICFDDDGDDDAVGVSQAGPKFLRFMSEEAELAAGVAVALVCVSWLALPFITRMDWGDHAYYAYARRRFFLFNLCAPASKGGQGMKVLGIVDGLGRDNVEHLKRLATNADSLALNGSVFSAVTAVSKTVRSSVKSAYGVGSSVKTNLVKVVPLWRESKRVVTVAEKGGGAPREGRDVVFAAKRFYISETDEDDFVVLVRRDAGDECVVSVSTQDNLLGARGRIHFEPLVAAPVKFDKGKHTAAVKLTTIHQKNWESILSFYVKIDDAEGRVDGRDGTVAEVRIVNDDTFPRNLDVSKTGKRLWLDADRHWILRVVVFCQVIYDDLKINIPLYFRDNFLIYYCGHFVFGAVYGSMYLPWIFQRILFKSIPEKNHAEAFLLAAMGVMGECLKQRGYYAFTGSWALGRFHNLRLSRHFLSLSYLQMHDQDVGLRFRKIFNNMESCVKNTWAAMIRVMGSLIKTFVILKAGRLRVHARRRRRRGGGEGDLRGRAPPAPRGPGQGEAGARRAAAAQVRAPASRRPQPPHVRRLRLRAAGFGVLCCCLSVLALRQGRRRRRRRRLHRLRLRLARRERDAPRRLLSDAGRRDGVGLGLRRGLRRRRERRDADGRRRGRQRLPLPAGRRGVLRARALTNLC